MASSRSKPAAAKSVTATTRMKPAASIARMRLLTVAAEVPEASAMSRAGMRPSSRKSAMIRSSSASGSKAVSRLSPIGVNSQVQAKRDA